MNNQSQWLEFFKDRERLHAEYYLNFAEENARRDPEAYKQLEAEIRNLFRVGNWLAEAHEAKGILKLATTLWQESDFIRNRGYMQRGIPLLEKACQAAQNLGDLKAEFGCLEALAYIYYDNANHALALPLYEQIIALALQLDEPQFVARGQLGMGRLQIELGNLDYATTLLQQALQSYRQIQDYKSEIETLIALTNLSSLHGDPSIATAYLNQALVIARSKQDLPSEVRIHYTFGYVHSNLEAWFEAAKHFQVAIKTAQMAGDLLLEARSMTALGEAWIAQGNVQQAIPILEKALAHQKLHDDILTEAFTCLCLAKGYNLLDQPQASLGLLQQIYPYLSSMLHFFFAINLAVEAAWIMADNYLKLDQLQLAQTALQDVLNRAPDHLIDIRRNAEELLQRLENSTKFKTVESIFLVEHERERVDQEILS